MIAKAGGKTRPTTYPLNGTGERSFSPVRYGTTMTRECPYCGKSFNTTQGLAQHCSGKHDKDSWIPQERLRKEYVKKERTSESLADEYDTTQKTINQLLKRSGIERRDNHSESCRALLGKPATFETMETGYERWRCNSGDGCDRVYVHRLLAVAEFGNVELGDVQVHHKNGIPWDNRSDNIELKDPKEHGRMHALEQWSD